MISRLLGLRGRGPERGRREVAGPAGAPWGPASPQVCVDRWLLDDALLPQADQLGIWVSQLGEEGSGMLAQGRSVG